MECCCHCWQWRRATMVMAYTKNGDRLVGQISKQQSSCPIEGFGFVDLFKLEAAVVVVNGSEKVSWVKELGAAVLDAM
ncbi:hypothetical protein F0562_015181 [Nyssa sinensis]|uniref:Uncharacterized protein n=1 Tax=Nyssa sinensis TaxID=561372 RepID=A0A5J4ZK92_9ASTE|nr:hypothetical protein F0562_015181 [Nyssa sinensis]